MAGDDSKAQPEVRRAANTAMDEIDAMLRELHALRARLISEIRASDDAAPRGRTSCCAGVSARRAVFRATPCSCMSVVIESSRAPGGTPANCGAN